MTEGAALDITLDDIHIRLGNFTLDADLSIPSGATAIIGPSGGGKSSLLSLLAGFISPNRGQIIFGKTNCTQKPPADRPVTLLFQENNLFPHLSIAKNVGIGIRPDLRLSKEQQAEIENALEQVGLGGFGTRKPAELSGGQRQRTALARALLRDKPVLMLDEPFAALGPALRQEMLDLVSEIHKKQGANLLLVTHNPEDALRIADNTVLVANGIVHKPQSTKELFDNPPEALASYLAKK